MLYQPAHFASTDRAHALALMRAHPLATLISVPPGADDPLISHAPLMVVGADAPAADALPPLHLLGHLAQANPHAHALRDGTSVTAIFHGPQGYVSPAWYQARKAVPTWNYAVVHVRGTVSRIDQSEGKEDVLKSLIDRHDPPYRPQWDELDLDYREGMKRGIVGFAIAVVAIAAKFKVSQNRSPADRAAVFAAMAQGDASARDLAQWMQRLGAA